MAKQRIPGFDSTEGANLEGGQLYDQGQPDYSITDPPVPGATPPPAAGAASKVPMQSFTNVGHDGQVGGMNREQWRDAYMSQGSASTQALDAWLQANGAQKLSDNGTYRTPFGEDLDLQIGAKSGGNAMAGWTNTGSGMGAGSGGGNGGGAGGAGGGQAMGFGDDLQQAIQGLFPGGMFNQNIVNQRTEGASEDLNRYKKSQQSGNDAVLAERGLLGSGPQQTAQNRLNSDVADQYSTAVKGIYADESQNADSRMMQALSLATGMSISQAQQAIDRYRAQNDFTLGQGNLALGNLNAQNSYDLGLRRDDLDRADLEERARQGDISAQIQLLQLQNQQTNTSSQGHR